MVGAFFGGTAPNNLAVLDDPPYGIADERDTEPDLILPLRAAEGTAAIFVEDGGGENQPFRPGNGLGVPEGRGGVKGDEVGEHVIDTVLLPA